MSSGIPEKSLDSFVKFFSYSARNSDLYFLKFKSVSSISKKNLINFEVPSEI